MTDVYANDFTEILTVLAQNESLRVAILGLVDTEFAFWWGHMH